MSWFQRYGIPGAYFVGLLVTRLYALYPGIVQFWGRQAVVGLALIVFLPIGYIISITTQWIYLTGRVSLITGRGVHGEAMAKLDAAQLENEDILEARTCILTPFHILEDQLENEDILEARTVLLTTLHTSAIPFESNKFLRDWIARRMDVIAINSSIIVANILAFVIFVLVFFFSGIPRTTFPSEWLWVFVPTIILVGAAMYFNRKKLTKQIIEVIAEIYRRHRNNI